jgi:HAD superfamily hydrolase (TIGR01484 family)
MSGNNTAPESAFNVLAMDYDETLAENGSVHAETLEALGRFRDSGRHLVLVTGREIPSLQRACPAYEIFDLIVAENGGLLYDPESQTETLLCRPLPEALIENLRRRNAVPMSFGRTIYATYVRHQDKIACALAELGLDFHLVFNKDYVMVLPAGITKASGLHAALSRLGRSVVSTVAIGDAENDVHLLNSGAYPVAVQNAVPMLRPHARLITRGCCGQGVVEVIDLILSGHLLRLQNESRTKALIDKFC